MTDQSRAEEEDKAWWMAKADELKKRVEDLEADLSLANKATERYKEAYMDAQDKACESHVEQVTQLTTICQKQFEILKALDTSVKWELCEEIKREIKLALAEAERMMK